MKAADLLQYVEYKLIKGDLDAQVTGICFDNRRVSAGDVFCCIKGVFFDTHTCLKQIADAGASLIVVSDDFASGSGDYGQAALDALADARANVISVPDTRLAKAFIASAWYGEPSKKLKVIGITGSKGKTTTTHLIASILEAAGHKAGLSGSNGIIIGEEFMEAHTTTPDSEVLQKALARMVEKGFEYAVIECSSQGLMLHRTAAIDFDAGVFLNIQEGDHVGPGEHSSFDNYLESKRLLLQNSRLCIVNADDPNLPRMLEGVAGKVVTFGHAGQSVTGCGSDPDYVLSDEQTVDVDGVPCVSFRTAGRVSGDHLVHLPGLFSAASATAALAVCNELGVDMKYIDSALASASVPGRLDIIYRSPELTICVDSAHNGASTRRVLEALREYEPKRLICVFGAGGNRDVDRRWGMGEASGSLADLSIVTSEHNRFETFETIFEGIKKGLDRTDGEYIVIPDRKEAIRYAIMNSRPGDLIAVIGLGYDRYQHCLGKDVPHSDIDYSLEVVREWLASGRSGGRASENGD